MKRENIIIIIAFVFLFINMAVFISCTENEVFRTNLALDNDTIHVSRNGISSKVIVYSDAKWKVELEEPDNTTWLSLSPDEKTYTINGKGTDYFQFTTQDNTTSVVRFGVFIISTNENSKRLVIRQAN